ncbi:MAG TPA: transposase [Opitutaceae bacterium]|nr:transposase [Opitutaceae bacterium]
MARKLRLAYPGAIYHVLNRSHNREKLFADEATKAAFVECLWTACERCGWLLHAYVIMEDHFHAAIETPQGNLAVGMQWLQSTFANRIGQNRPSHRPLFQGRFKAMPVESTAVLGKVCHYIHLNPVRAGLVSVRRLTDYDFCSYRFLWRPDERPACLRFAAALQEAGGLPDDSTGWQAYERYLEWQNEHGPAGRNPAYRSMSRGWMIGSDAFRNSLLEQHQQASTTHSWRSLEVRKEREARWNLALSALLEAVPDNQRGDRRKSAPWKVSIASQLKATTDVSNAWLADKLAMGSPIYVSKHVGLARRGIYAKPIQLQKAEISEGKVVPPTFQDDHLPVNLL